MYFDFNVRSTDRLFTLSWDGTKTAWPTKKKPLRTVLRKTVRSVLRTRGRNLLPEYREGGTRWSPLKGELKYLVRTHKLSYRHFALRYTRRYPMTQAEIAQWADRSNLEQSRRLAHTT